MREEFHPAEAVPVLVLEDDEDQREALVVTLRLLGIAADGAATVAEFQDRQGTQTYAVAIIDLGLPDGDGREIVRSLAEQTGMGIIILSAAAAVEERIRGFDTGADLYFVKPADYREVASAALRLALRRGFGAPPIVPRAPQKPWVLVPSRWSLTSPAGGEVVLTPKERLVVEALAERPGEAVLRSDLLRRLHYPDEAAGHRRLEALIRRLRLKLEEIAPDNQPVATVYGIGYAFSRALMNVPLPENGPTDAELQGPASEGLTLTAPSQPRHCGQSADPNSAGRHDADRSAPASRAAASRESWHPAAHRSGGRPPP